MKLDQWMIANGETQMSLARHLGVSHTTVSRWVSKKTFPSPVMVRALFNLTSGQVTAVDLFDQPQDVLQGAA